jgi:sulfur carrier protein
MPAKEKGEGMGKGPYSSKGYGFYFNSHMRLVVNGEGLETGAETVMGLMDELRIEPGRVAVEVNLKVVRKNDYRDFRLKEGDKVEIVNFVGGG